MKINLTIDTTDLVEVAASDMIELYDNLSYKDIDKFLEYIVSNSNKAELMQKILEHCSKKEIKELEELIEDYQ